MGEKASRKTSHEYRGCCISVKPGDNCTLLTIDEKEISCIETESGVTCDDFMYMEFSSVHHLAEHLVKQWGSAKIERAPSTPGHAHGNHE